MGLSGRASVLAALVVLFAGAASAGERVEPLPFVGDEAGFPDEPLQELTWPDRFEPDHWSEDWIPGLSDDDDERELPQPAWVFPDVDDLLAPVTFAVQYGDSAITVIDDHDDAARATRLLTAVRAAYARDLRVRIDVLRTAEGDTARSVARIDTTTRMGGLLVVDGRRDEIWPAGIYASPVLVTPEAITFQLGTHTALHVTPLDNERAVLNLDIHVAESVDERTFESPALKRVAPIVATTHLRAALPLRIGELTRATLGDVTFEIRIDRDGTTPVEGVLALPLPSPEWLSPAVQVHPRSEGLIPERFDGGRSMTVSHALPATWAEAADTAGVRLVAVPPGMAFAEGEPDALQRFAAAVAALRRVRARVVRDSDTGLSLPTVVGAPWTFDNARLTPIADDVGAEIQMVRANTSVNVRLAPSGDFAHGDWVHGDGDGTALETTFDFRRVRERKPATVKIGASEGGGTFDELTLTEADLTASSRRFMLRGKPDEHSTGSLTPLEGWE